MNLLFVQGEGAVEASAPAQQAEVIEVSTTATDAPVVEAPAASGGMFWLMIIAMIAIMYFCGVLSQSAASRWRTSARV